MTYGDVVGSISLLVSGVGFWLAIAQLKRTAKAAEATTTAVSSANERMLLNHMLVMLPQMRSTDSDLDAAIASDDVQAAVRALVQFSYSAKQIATLLESDDAFKNSVLIADLHEAAASASAGKATLIYGANQPLKKVLQPIGEQLARVAGECAALSARYQLKAS